MVAFKDLACGLKIPIEENGLDTMQSGSRPGSIFQLIFPLLMSLGATTSPGEEKQTPKGRRIC